MVHLIDKDRIVAEIERQIELLKPFLGACAGQIVAEANDKLSVLEGLKNFLDTLKVEEMPILEKVSPDTGQTTLYQSGEKCFLERDGYRIDLKELDKLPKKNSTHRTPADIEAAMQEVEAMMELTHFDGYAMLEAIEFGANWKEEQFEKNRIKHCNSISKEQAELEQKFLDEHLDKHGRMPTFLDAIEYGMRLQKEQLMKGAFEFAQKHNDACVLASECLRNHGWFNREHDFNDLFLYLSCVDERFAGKFSGKTKVIVIKED